LVPFFEICRGSSSLPVVLSCDHGSDEIPAEYGNLGMSSAHVEECSSGMDKGAASVFEHLVQELDCRGIRSRISRLVVDMNRYVDQDELIPEHWGGKPIPGNRGLSRAARQQRIARYHAPYHRALVELLVACERRHGVAFYFAIHAMAPEFEGEVRDMDFALICNRGRRWAPPLQAAMAARGFTATVNEPYSLERDIVRVPAGSEYERFNDHAVIIEINETRAAEPAARQALRDAIRTTVRAGWAAP